MAPRPKGTDVVALFWSLTVRQDNGCLEFQGSPSDRYGFFSYEGKLQKAHRVSYQIENGPIPDGMKVLHTCDNSRCVEPDHLFLGTQADNMKDMCQKGRHWTQASSEGEVVAIRTKIKVNRKPASMPGESNPSAKMTEAMVEQIIRLNVAGDSYGKLVARFGFSKTQIVRICTGQSWKKVAERVRDDILAHISIGT